MFLLLARCGRSVSLALLLLCALPASADLVLNGSAVYQQLTRNYYLAGLYLPQPAQSAETIFSPAVARRMQLVVTTDHWSPRKWRSQWQNNIAINNDGLQASPQLQQALMDFTRLLRRDLQTGDEIRIDYQPGGATRIQLNRELVMTENGPQLFDALLRTWVGKLPPSREFRQQILGITAINEGQRQTLLSHRIPEARQQLYSGWLAEEAAIAAAEEARTAARLAAQAAAEDARREQQRQAEEARLAEQAQAEEQARQQQQQARLQAARDDAEREQLQKAAVLQQAAAQQQARRLVGQTSNVLGAGKTAAVLAQEQIYYLQLLQWRMQRQVQAEVSYPAWAKQFKEEGLAQVDFRLQRDKSVLQTDIRNTQISDLLNSELVRALRVAALQVEVPPDLDGDSWPLAVSYHFSLQGEEPPLAAMPEVPASLRQGALPAAQQQQLLAAYRAAQLQRIYAAVTYPAAARILKKQGPVVLEADIAADGRLLAVRPLHPSVHRELNDALQAAVQQSAPFPALPAGSDETSLTLTVSYEFRL